MGYLRPENEQSIELWLRGSDMTPYGRVYVPEGHASVMDPTAQVDSNPGKPYKYMQRIDNRWLYVESP
jgi:hypothetical protein